MLYFGWLLLGMPVDVEKIIQFIKQGDQDNVQIHLDDYNAQVNRIASETLKYN